MSTRTFLLFIFAALTAGFLFIRPMFQKPMFQKQAATTIGILQTASHFALDQARETFIEEMKRLTNGEIDFIVQNAEGSLSTAQTIAESFHAHRKIDAIYAIGTPAVQAIVRVEKHKPVFIAAVSDPESLGLFYKGTNVCGTTDRIHTEDQIDFVAELLPGIQNVALLYNPGESNSSSMVKKMEQSLLKRGIVPIVMGVHSESEIGSAVLASSRKAQALLLPADNLLAAAMPLVAKEALKRKCPLIVSDLHYISKGAFAAQGVDYREQGKRTAEMAYCVLCSGQSPESVGIVDPLNAKQRINKKIWDQLEISISPELISKVELFDES